MRKILSFLLLSVAVVVCVYPFAWMFLSSFKTNKEIYQPTLFFPSDYEWDSYAGLWSGEYLSFFDYFLHSILVSGGQALLATLVTAAAGFAFSKLSFRGSSWLFGVAVLVILVPKQALAVPLFEWMAWLGWQGDLWSLALPGVASGLGPLFGGLGRPGG